MKPVSIHRGGRPACGRPGRAPDGARRMALVMLALFLATLALAAVPEFHHVLHEDADANSHHCVVTQIAQCQVELLPITLAVPVPCSVATDVPAAPDFLHASAPPRLLSGRGPPALA